MAMAVAARDTTVQRINRNLLTFAFVSQRLTKTNDYMQSLIPLFIPIIEDMNATIFNPTDFSKRVGGFYGMHISPDVVEELVPRLVSEGLLKSIRESSEKSAYICVAPQKFSDYEDEYTSFRDKLDLVLGKFISFVREELCTLQTISYTDTQLEEILIEWLIYSDTDFTEASKIINADGTTDNQEGERSLKNEEEYLCARFLKMLEKNDVQLFNDLSIIASGAMVSEVVLDIIQPVGKNYKFADLQIYLDGPMLMNFLGLSGAEKKENTEYIINNLKTLGCKIRVFSHNIDEVTEAIKTTLQTPAQIRRGPLADAIRMNSTTEDYARSVSANIEDLCSQNDFQIVDAKFIIANNEKGFFDENLEDEFISKLTPWNNLKARERDALSMKIIMQKRKGFNSRDLFKHKFCMITSNSNLFKISQKFCFENGLIRDNQLGPFVHARRVSAILFLMLGAKERAELSRRQLLANCSRALVSNPDVVEAMRAKLKAIKPEFESIMSVPRYVQFSMDLTLGSAVILGNEGAGKIIDLLKQDIAKDIEQSAQQKYKEKSKSDKRKIEDQENLLREMEGKLVAANDSIDQKKNSDIEMFKKWLSSCSNFFRSIELIAKILISLAISYFSYLMHFEAVSSSVQLALWSFSTLFMVLLTFWVPGRRVRNIIKEKFVKFAFNQIAKISNKSDAVASLNIDFVNAKVTERVTLNDLLG